MTRGGEFFFLSLKSEAMWDINMKVPHHILQFLFKISVGSKKAKSAYKMFTVTLIYTTVTILIHKYEATTLVPEFHFSNGIEMLCEMVSENSDWSVVIPPPN
jgi:hypothetical protein